MNKTNSKVNSLQITLIFVSLLAVMFLGLYIMERNNNSKLNKDLLEQSSAVNVINGETAISTSAEISLATGVLNPVNTTILEGTKVTWRNGDYADYTIVSMADAPEQFESKTLKADDSFSFTFNKPGTYNYYVKERANTMAGQIIVEQNK